MPGHVLVRLAYWAGVKGRFYPDQVRDVAPRTPEGCEERLKTKGQWVRLRLCITCGRVGCCDHSPGGHATTHFHESTHPIIRSLAPGETWGWCYVDEMFVKPPRG